MDIFDTAGRRQRLMDAFAVNPDQKAEQIRIGRDMGVLPSMVDGHTRNLHKLNKTEKQMEGLSVLPRVVADKPAFAELAQDDIARLAAIENIQRERRRRKAREDEAQQRINEPNALEEFGSSFWRSLRGVVNATDLANAAGYAREADRRAQGYDPVLALNLARNPDFDINAYLAETNDEIAGLREKSREWVQKYEEDLPDTVPRLSEGTQKQLEEYQQQKGFWGSVSYAVRHPNVLSNLTASSFGALAPALALTAVSGASGGASAATIAMGGSVFATEYASTMSQMVEQSAAQGQKTRDDVLADRELMRAIERESRIRGAVIGSMEAFTLGATSLIYKTLAARPALALGGSMAAQTTGGVVGEAGAQIVSRGEIHDMPSVAAEAMLGPVMSVPEVASFALFGKQQMAAEHEQDLADLEAQIAAVNNSLLGRRAPEELAEYVREVVQESDAEHLYIDGNALHQSGLAAALLEAVPEYNDAVQEAIQTGGSVQLRSEDFLTRVAVNDELAAGLREQLRFDPDGLSLAELDSSAQAELHADLLARERSMAQMDAAELERDKVYNHIHEQLMATGRYSADVARTNSILLTAFFETMGTRMGENMQQLYERLGLRIVSAADGEGGVLNQAVAEHPPRGWRHSTDAQDAASLWTTNPQEAAQNESVFWTIENAADTGIADTQGYSHSISKSTAFHIFKEHGDSKKEGGRGQLPVTAEDLSRIPGIVVSPDAIYTGFQSEQGAERVAYMKRYDDALVVYIAEASRKKKDFRAISIRKYPPTAKSENIAKNISSQSLNVRNGEGAYANNTPIFRGSQESLYQDPAASGVFSSREAQEFAATAEAYGGEAAYNAAREAGETELDYRQWVQVRTPAFKAWFGDWEGDPDNASKVINPNTGEPLVVYHYTEEQFSRFELSRARQSSDIPAFFFTTDPEMGAEYGRNEMQVFLNIRNPTDKPGISTDKDGQALRGELIGNGYDGTLVDDSYDDVLSVEYAAFHPNQIKSATDNSGAFSADNDSILHQDGLSPRGQFSPATNTIVLFENADLSTLPHELGHFFLEALVGFANDLRHIDGLQGGNTLSETERGIIRDVDTLMDWFGVDLPTWNRMTLDEQRGFHEQFARGFEQFLLEGRAPSFELGRIFARIRAWMLRLYSHARNLNVPMTDEVRQVFGRLLASDEAIKLAEQNRSMAPMFESAEEAGMTAEQFAEYQRAHQDAGDAALDEMQARSVRDLRLIRNLKSKKLRELQRAAREIRQGVMMEARREVLSRPVYRAWQMLTARNPATAAAKPKWQAAVDSRHDSLLTAIAKLGGLDDAKVRSEWGFEDDIKRPHPHHPVIRKRGGMSLDDMATALMEHGYLPQDYHLNDFYDRFMLEFSGNPQYSGFYEPDTQTQADADYGAFAALRLDAAALQALGYGEAEIKALGKMVRKSGGVHPDTLADIITDADGNPVYDSGDALLRDLLSVPPPQEAINNLADNIMLERHGELATPEALLEAAEMAAHNETRLRVLVNEANALAKAAGSPQLTARAARQLAREVMAGKRLRDIKPRQYTRMETRAAKAAERARKKGDIATAAAEKRNQVLQAALARAAWEAQEEAAAQVRLLKRLSKLNPKSHAIEYREQIEAILERYNLREQSGKALERRQSLAQWVEAERAKGNEPALSAQTLDELQRKPWQELTPAELQALADDVTHIAHLGQLKNKLLVKRKNQDMDAVKDELAAGIAEHATQSGIVNRTATDARGKSVQALGRYFFSHLRVNMLARLFDGDRDGGMFWQHIIRPMNDAANWQTATRTQAVKDLDAILQPLLNNKRRKEKIATDLPDLDGKRRSLSVEEVFVMALNMGNDGNKQRLLSGNRWHEDAVRAQLSRLSAAELHAVQAIWDYFEQFKPQVAALERRTKGVEPDWVEAVPLSVMSADGVLVDLRGGYYPVRYDTRASVQAAKDAEALDVMREQVGRTAMTTRQSYTKARADEVHDRPLMLDMSGLFTGLNEVIHDLAYREVLMDTQRLIGSKRVSDAIRSHYGDEVYKQINEWLRDIAIGDLQRESALVAMLNKVRRYGTFAYLGYNLMSAAAQPLGLLQSAARIGTGRTMAETARYLLNPTAIAQKNREANQASVFMADRGSTQMRELNELANSLLVGNTLQNRMLRYSYVWLMTVQKQVDVITWHAARQKALEEGFNDTDAVAIADQAVIDTQGSGMIKDLSKVERDNATRIFTVFYSFMNAILNLEYVGLKAKNSMAKKAEVLLLLSVAVPILNALMRSALKPGEDEDKWGADGWYKTIGREIVNHHLGLFVGAREFQMSGFAYSGPVGLHLIEDYRKLGEQISQGEADNALRKALVNAVGATTGAPSVAINRFIDGVQAMADGDTANPAVLAFGREK